MADHIPIEETNLADIGSEEDKAAREAAAKIDFHWEEGVGSKPGVEIWRVENKRTENDNPDFGIAVWPEKMHGQFHRGDSYIVLLTTKDPNGEKFFWDIFFWIGSESTQDEYGVAAYKVVELDDILGGDPMQHREIEGRESRGFVNCFPKGITYLEGGVDSGFRKVSNLDDDEIMNTHRMYRVYKKKGEQTTRCFEVPLKCSSLNEGDAFLLDAGSKIYTWFGSSVSAFEKNKSASVAHNIKENRLGSCECILDVEDDDEEFWELLGGKGEIKPAEEAATEDSSGSAETKMYVVSDSSGPVKVKEVPLSKSALASDDVCIVDAGNNAYVWIGKGSTKGEKQQAMLISYRYLKAMGRYDSTCVTRVMEGQEARCRPFLEVF
mmetsp:Transcript_9081/g.20524  ORF Transcript_9081/g.20524 Transcript_9081/m.20524 type:complete len:380 (-) Transcript_9081:1364-2503(-)|eukprot:CAMPEP_0172316714 /NCGR_PEP_ID=MMETSP1058-20130122/29232_1 /TAXON_ID=83371 /ORGANISM="Detonula confervacea, Strain CCMP 353" /LENGTH=379 /DNA_ID=CAMNT_0013031101 /DNA_START=62 /DNA_END=1201 /DNA_ORIENTATION=+